MARRSARAEGGGWIGGGKPQQSHQIRAQLGWTLLGSGVVFVCILVTCIVWLVNFEQTNEAMELNSSQFRKEQARALSLEVASLLRPVYTVATRLAFEMDNGLSAVVRDPETYQNLTSISGLQPILYPAMRREVHIRSMRPDGSDRRLWNFMGVVFMLALDQNNQPVADMSQCSHAVWTSLLLDSPDPSSETYMIDHQFVNDSDPRGLSRKFYGMDLATLSVGAVVVEDVPLLTPCSWPMAPLIRGRGLPGFRNFTWYGPHNPKVGWGSLLEGTVPIYDEGRRPIGRVSTLLSLGESVAPMLREVIAAGGDLTRNGQGAVFAQDGALLGLTETGASRGEEQADFLEDVVPESDTGRALALLRERFGTVCPPDQHFVTTAERLVDVTPFSSEDYGLAPLGQRWCQLMTVPRENVFKPIDRAASSGVAVGILAGLGVFSAVAMLGRSLFLTLKAHLRVMAEKKQALWRRAEAADLAVHSFGAPMVLLNSWEFLKLDTLVCYETLRDSGKLRFLDDLDKVDSFKAQANIIVLISHQWLGFKSPDTEDSVQLRAMQRMIRLLVNMERLREVYVWLDYTSVAQHHVGQMKLAISSLPAYVSVADYFVICAPDAVHQDTGAACDLDSYSRRGWCRTEMFAKACSTGLTNMYICSGSGKELQPYQRADFDKVSLKVFEGDFTDRRDMEVLVEPVLGLYGHILRSQGLEHVEMVREHVEKEKEGFFPASYAPDKDQPNRRRDLFGPLVRVMEEHIESGHGITKIPSRRQDAI